MNMYLRWLMFFVACAPCTATLLHGAKTEDLEKIFTGANRAMYQATTKFIADYEALEKDPANKLLVQAVNASLADSAEKVTAVIDALTQFFSSLPSAALATRIQNAKAQVADRMKENEGKTGIEPTVIVLSLAINRDVVDAMPIKKYTREELAEIVQEKFTDRLAEKIAALRSAQTIKNFARALYHLTNGAQ